MERYRQTKEEDSKYNRRRKETPIARQVLIGMADRIKNKPLRALARLIFS